MSRLALCLAFSAAIVAGGVSQTGTALRHAGNKGSGFVKALEFKHRLRVCNAYPYESPLDVFRDHTEKLTEEPLPYKSCIDFAVPLHAGDKLAFKVGSANAGTFAISDLPNNDAVLLLVIHRHDTLSTAVAFESHVFANLLNAQVAVIDTFKGSARSVAAIRDGSSNKERSEQLRYNSVVAVNPGIYQVVLTDSDGTQEASGELVALNRESYVIIRTGVDAQQGPSFPQGLVVFPQSDASLLKDKKSGALAPLANVYVLLTSLLVALFH